MQILSESQTQSKLLNSKDEEKLTVEKFLREIRNMKPKTIKKRFSDFVKLKEEFSKSNLEVFLPSLPSKKFYANFNIQDEEFIERRAFDLEIFLNKILTCKKIYNSKIFKNFINNVNSI